MDKGLWKDWNNSKTVKDASGQAGGNKVESRKHERMRTWKRECSWVRTWWSNAMKRDVNRRVKWKVSFMVRLTWCGLRQTFNSRGRNDSENVFLQYESKGEVMKSRLEIPSCCNSVRAESSFSQWSFMQASLRLTTRDVVAWLHYQCLIANLWSSSTYCLLVKCEEPGMTLNLSSERLHRHLW